MAGSWLIASVCMLRMKHMSSTILAVYGSSSLTHMPALAVLGELVLRRGDREPRLAEVIVVSRWPMRTESGRSLSYHSSIFGL